jgi:hypothetical protein
MPGIKMAEFYSSENLAASVIFLQFQIKFHILQFRSPGNQEVLAETGKGSG